MSRAFLKPQLLWAESAALSAWKSEIPSPTAAQLYAEGRKSENYTYLTQLLVPYVKHDRLSLVPQHSCFEGLCEALDKSQMQKTDRSGERKAKIFLFEDEDVSPTSQ